MARLKVPSLQHLARNWRDRPARICRELVALVDNPPWFNYNPLFAAIIDLLVLRQPYDQVAEGIRRGVKRAEVRDNLLEVLPLLRDHFADLHPDFVQAIDPRSYPLGRGLSVAFAPPLVYGVGGKLYFPWFSFWRQNPLADVRLQLFVTLVREMLSQDADLEDAEFLILDFSVRPADPNEVHRETPRHLVVTNAADIPSLDDDTRTRMLTTFVEGYVMAVEELASRSVPEPPSEPKDDRQGDFFDEPPPP